MVSSLVLFGDQVALSGQPSWAKQAANRLRLELYDYARVGATTLDWERSYTRQPNSTEYQVNQYLSLGAPPQDAVFVICSGINDALSYEITPERTAEGLVRLADQLKEAGAAHVVLVAPYSLNRLPRSFDPDVSGDELQKLSFYSSILAVSLAQAGWPFLDFYSLFSRIMHRPASYGFSPDADLIKAVASPENTDSLFATEVLPSTKAGKLMAEEAIRVLQPLLQKTVTAYVQETKQSNQSALLQKPPQPIRRASSPGLRTD